MRLHWRLVFHSYVKGCVYANHMDRLAAVYLSRRRAALITGEPSCAEIAVVILPDFDVGFDSGAYELGAVGCYVMFGTYIGVCHARYEDNLHSVVE